MRAVDRVLEKFEARIKARYPGEDVKILAEYVLFHSEFIIDSSNGFLYSRKAHDVRTTGPVPLVASRSLPAHNVSGKRQNRGANKSGPRRAAARPPSIISASDFESSEGEHELDSLTSTPTPSLIVPAPAPLSTSTGGCTPRPPSGPAVTVNVVAAPHYPDFEQYQQFLQYRGRLVTEHARIYHPPEGSIGDGESWYYVTVGRTVGVFNIWYCPYITIPARSSLNDPRALVHHSVTGVANAAWKRVTSREIAYNVMANALIQRTVVVVND